MWYWGVQLIRYYPPHMWPTPTTMQINISQDHNGAMLQPSTSTRMAAPQVRPTRWTYKHHLARCALASWPRRK